MDDPKLLELLDMVIDNYLCKGDPVGSKFLHSLKEVNYAPSTLRKYLNILEKEGMLYQPYNSSGRIPTLEGLSAYIEHYILDNVYEENENINIQNAREGLTYLVESLGQLADGVVVGFLRNDEYYYLGINNLLREDLLNEYETTKQIVKFIENKKIISFLDKKIIKNNQVYYTFLKHKKTVMSCIYAKITVGDYDGIISIVGPMRVNYKKNINIIKNLIKSLNKKYLNK